MSIIKSHEITLYGGNEEYKVILRPLSDDYLPYLYKWNADPEVLYWTEGGEDICQSYSPEIVHQIYGGISQENPCFAVEVNGEIIGECWLQKMNLSNVIEMYPEGTDVRRIDMAIGEKIYWGKGIGTLFIGTLVEYAFNTEKVDVLHCFCEDYNVRSRRVWEKNGFSLVLTEELPKGQKGTLQYHWRLTRDEYYERRCENAMDKRIKIINDFYNGYVEDARLSRSRHGQLEYLTTMKYIHRIIPEKSSIIEVGAGTGRYSIALAKEGHDVTAIELAKSNLELLLQNSEGLKNFKAYQGDALDLSLFHDNTFDLTLVFGPLYHLYDERDQQRALDEAIRVTREGGTIMVAFLSVHAILFDNYLQGNLLAGIEENFTKDYQVKHFTEQLFTGFNVDEFEALFRNKPVEWITTVAADSILELAENRKDFAMSDEDFSAFAKYHLHNCERRELLGSSSHLLYICKKLKG